LRKVQIQPKNKAAAPKVGNDVASILMRRVALEMNDSDSDEDEGTVSLFRVVHCLIKFM
jgi:hypothetical protein